MGRLEELSRNVQVDLDMQTLTQMQMADDIHAMRYGEKVVGGRGRHASYGWRNRGILFWIMLAFMIYWFFLRHLGW